MLASTLGMVLFSCGNEDVPPAPVSRVVADVVITPGELHFTSLFATMTLTATARDADGRTITGKSFEWFTDDQDVAGVQNDGVVTAAGNGGTTITATVDGKSGEASVTVQQEPASVTIDGVDDGLTLWVDESRPLSASVRDGRNNVMPNVPVVWNSISDSIVSIDAVGTMTGLRVGETQIVATAASVSDTVDVSVDGFPTDHIAIEPEQDSLFAGDSLRLTITIVDTKGDTVIGRPLDLQVTDSSVISVNEEAWVTGISSGQASVVASSGDISNGAAFTVLTVNSIELSPSSPIVQVGDTVRLSATLQDRSGGILTNELVFWRSTNPSLASVSGDGLVTGHAPGTVSIVANAETATDSAVVSVVRSLPSASGQWRGIVPGFAFLYEVVEGTNGSLTGDGVVADGRQIITFLYPGTVSGQRRADSIDLRIVAYDTLVWDYAGVLSQAVDSAFGRVSGSLVGDDSLALEHLPFPVRIEPASATMLIGEQLQFVARNLNDLGQVSWHSIDPSIIAIDAYGLATGMSSGEGQIVATSPGIEADTIQVSVVGFTAIAAGGVHTCAIASSGTAFCWGNDGSGQLGRGISESVSFGCSFRPVGTSTSICPVPSFVGGTTEYVSEPVTPTMIANGDEHSCVLSDVGHVHCWGSDARGQLGRGSSPGQRRLLQQIADDASYVAVSAGGQFTCGLKASGDLSCWGENTNGQLGNGTTADADSPTTVVSSTSFSAIASGFAHACAVDVGGVLYCWGRNDHGQLGDSTHTDRLVPHPVAGDLRFIAVSAGPDQTCGISDSNRVLCWGSGFGGALGSGNQQDSDVPRTVFGDMAFTQISSGGELFGGGVSCGLATVGGVYCWGSNGFGQLGNPVMVNATKPTLVHGGQTFSSVTVGQHHTCAVATSGETFCWGDNRSGQVGDATLTTRYLPTRVVGNGPR